jgi:hypothetical protein
MHFPAPSILHPAPFVIEGTATALRNSSNINERHVTPVAETGAKCQNRTIADLLRHAGYWMLGASIEGGVLRAQG